MTDVERIVSEIAKLDVIFKWKIKNFSAQDLVAGALKSPPFRCCGANFHLEVSRMSDDIYLLLVQRPSADDPPRISSCVIGFVYPDLKDWHGTYFEAPVKHTNIFYSISVDTLLKDEWVAYNELSVECQITASIFHSISVDILEEDCAENDELIVQCENTASILEHTVDDQAETLTAKKNMTDIVRQVSEIVPHKVNFDWIIKNFSAQDLLAGAVKSPSFRCCGANFHLEVSRKLNEIHLQLVQLNFNVPPRISKCSIGFNYSHLADWDYRYLDAPVKHTDISHSISIDTIMKDFVENNELSVECQITASILEHNVNDQPVTLTAGNEENQCSKQGHTTLCENFRRILEDSRFADVTLKVGEHTFQAHKAILSGRSRVFEGMFQSDMKENQESVVEMVDMETSTLKEMLQYIYAGAIGKLSVLEAIDLYVGADRYDLQELKGWCRELILEHISSDLVCRVAELADLHSDEELATASKRVFRKNSKTIVASKSWREFGKQNPAVQTNLLESALLSYCEN